MKNNLILSIQPHGYLQEFYLRNSLTKNIFLVSVKEPKKEEKVLTSISSKKIPIIKFNRIVKNILKFKIKFKELELNEINTVQFLLNF